MVRCRFGNSERAGSSRLAGWTRPEQSRTNEGRSSVTHLEDRNQNTDNYDGVVEMETGGGMLSDYMLMTPYLYDMT